MLRTRSVESKRTVVDQLERDAIDREIAKMADDADYRAESVKITDELAPARWEAFQIAEGHAGDVEP